MRKIFCILISLVILSTGTLLAEEYGSVYVWYPGDAVEGAPKETLISDTSFGLGKDEFITSVTVKGYGQSVKRMYLVFTDSKGKKGATLLNQKFQQNKISTVNVPMKDAKRWVSVSLEYRIKNFNRNNRTYRDPALFWIESIKTNKAQYKLEQPSSDDDVKP